MNFTFCSKRQLVIDLNLKGGVKTSKPTSQRDSKHGSYIILISKQILTRKEHVALFFNAHESCIILDARQNLNRKEHIALIFKSIS